MSDAVVGAIVSIGTGIFSVLGGALGIKKGVEALRAAKEKAGKE